MKVDRNKIWLMFGKKCAYCGCDLLTSTGKHMQIDHVEPIVRNWWSNTSMFPENNRFDNLFPTCPPCNNYKHTMSVDEFRDQIRYALPRLLKTASYRNAYRFGLVKECNWDGRFWFEKYDSIIESK